MDIIGLLIQKIVQLLLMLLMGYTIVRCKILRAEDSMVLSKISLYLIAPCTIIKAFQIKLNVAVMEGFLYALAASLVIHILLIILLKIWKHIFHLNVVETASVFYSNAGNLIIPLVAYLFGDEWVIYTSGFILVQTIFIWTHGVSLFRRSTKIQWKKILLNINLISIVAGLALMLLRISLPDVMLGTLESVGAMIGPAAMMISGMLAADMSMKNIFCSKRTYLIAIMRLVLTPGFILLSVKGLMAMNLIPAGDMITLIVLLAVMTPSASTIVQLAQIHDCNAQYAGAINILSIVLCVITMPAMVYVYLL